MKAKNVSDEGATFTHDSYGRVSKRPYDSIYLFIFLFSFLHSRIFRSLCF